MISFVLFNVFRFSALTFVRHVVAMVPLLVSSPKSLLKLTTCTACAKKYDLGIAFCETSIGSPCMVDDLMSAPSYMRKMRIFQVQ